MRDQEQQVLDAIAGRHPNANNKVRANCPFCVTVADKVDRKQCLELDLVSGWSKCYRCDTRVKLTEIPFDTSSLTTAPREERPAVNLPEGFVPLWKPEGKVSVSCEPARKYLRKGRIGITPEIIAGARIGACVRGRYRGRIVVPIYKGGKLVGCMTRIWRKKAPPGVQPYLYTEGLDRGNTLYNEDALYVTSATPAIIVEGCFDTYPFWPDGVAVLGKASAGQYTMLRNARRPLLIVFDGDAHRQATALAMHLRLDGKNAAALRLEPGTDPDEAHQFVKEQARSIFALGEAS